MCESVKVRSECGEGGNGVVIVALPDGVYTWVKLRATNNGEGV